MTVARDQFEQYAMPMDQFTEREWELFSILEEVASTARNEDKTLLAYMADILDLWENE